MGAHHPHNFYHRCSRPKAHIESSRMFVMVTVLLFMLLQVNFRSRFSGYEVNLLMMNDSEKCRSSRHGGTCTVSQPG